MEVQRVGVHIAHIAHIARSWGRVEVQRVGVHIADIAHSMELGENGGSAGWRPYSTYSTYSMELGESGAKPRYICAVLRHKMRFFQCLYQYRHWKNSSFCGFAPQKCYSYSAYINVGTRGIAFARVLHGLPMPALI